MIDAGKINKDAGLFILDNDQTSFIFRFFKDDKYTTIYEGGDPMQLLADALDLLGIPWDNA